MFEPITSEVNLHTGQILKEIATGVLYQIGVKASANAWEIKEINPDTKFKIIRVADRQELSIEYFAETEGE